ncbi:MAG: hypothetical protein B6244_08895 [Candidatus Cloacimonetes bacterium 4572_55]|nr:MAG: hypothetical protein B6244_08895 [Candidatus Cloacimonetes bacterium 4572_55]
MGDLFTNEDIRQIQEKGMTLEQVMGQAELFRRGILQAIPDRPCLIGDGIVSIPDSDANRLTALYQDAAEKGRTMKFVPASGAASRMFRSLQSVNNQYKQLNHKELAKGIKANRPDHQLTLYYIEQIEDIAFYDDLRMALEQAGYDIAKLLNSSVYKLILEYTLTPAGLNYANQPKGMIKFHRYADHVRTAFEEHLVEAAAHTTDKLHFTVPSNHWTDIESFLDRMKPRYEPEGRPFQIGYSVQKSSTDTIGFEMTEDRPFRDRSGRLVFRPGGHGALLENLNELQGDLIFIKNIDNVVPDRLKSETIRYKYLLAGYLIDLQSKSFDYLQRIASGDADKPFIEKALQFARRQLHIFIPDHIKKGSASSRIGFLREKLNRPMRVCGMVENEGEPGGGPYWVTQRDGSISLQILESSQININSAEQQAIMRRSTHFNPVDLVCAVRDYKGEPFDLIRYRDPDTAFISNKSKEGKEMRALELPGLWNGAMADWITLFVEVPLITFNPVKTVFDLLRKEHR